MIEELVTYLETLNSLPLPSDLVAIFLDGKSIYQKRGEGVREYTTYVVMGLTIEGQKMILALYTFGAKKAGKTGKRFLKSYLRGHSL